LITTSSWIAVRVRILSDNARAAVQDGLALDPSFTIRRLRSIVLSDNPTYVAARERVIEGMRLAGVPEG
jgi:hypothetical protein